MNNVLMKLAFILAAAAILAGCGSKARYPNYYTINLPAPPDAAAAENAHASLAIREFRAPAYLRQGAIVYKTSPQQVGFYTYHRWASEPSQTVTNSVIDHLRATGIFGRVSSYDGHSDIDYVLSGRLEKLEEVDYEGAVKVEVAISARITSLATGATVWTNAVSEVGDVNKRDVPAVVSEMTRTMERAIEKLLAAVPSHLATTSVAAK
jgi:ABC-type uncharacterized transport system auxiliary subunit